MPTGSKEYRIDDTANAIKLVLDKVSGDAPMQLQVEIVACLESNPETTTAALTSIRLSTASSIASSTAATSQATSTSRPSLPTSTATTTLPEQTTTLPEQTTTSQEGTMTSSEITTTPPEGTTVSSKGTTTTENHETTSSLSPGTTTQTPCILRDGKSRKDCCWLFMLCWRENDHNKNVTSVLYDIFTIV